LKSVSTRKLIKALKDKNLISVEDLKTIKADLINREYESFDRFIKTPLRNQIPIWLKELYPDLSICQCR